MKFRSCLWAHICGKLYLQSKLTFPICYNYLNMGKVAGGIQRNDTIDYSKSSVFIQYIGPAVNMTPLFGDGYNDWVPWILVIVCAVFFFNLHGRFLRFFSSSSYFYEPIHDENVESLEGQEILKTARAAWMRRSHRGAAPGPSTFPATEGTAQLLARYREKSVKADKTATEDSKRSALFNTGKTDGYQRIDNDM